MPCPGPTDDPQKTHRRVVVAVHVRGHPPDTPSNHQHLAPSGRSPGMPKAPAQLPAGRRREPLWPSFRLKLRTRALGPRGLSRLAWTDPTRGSTVTSMESYGRDGTSTAGALRP